MILTKNFGTLPKNYLFEYFVGMTTLTAKNKDFCMYAGVFGFMFSLTCLIQHFMFTYPHWITGAFAILYVFSMLSFGLFTAQKNPSPKLLIIDSALLFIASVLLIKVGIISVVVILSFIYTTVIALVSNMEELPKKFKQKELELKAERELWKNKI